MTSYANWGDNWSTMERATETSENFQEEAMESPGSAHKKHKKHKKHKHRRRSPTGEDSDSGEINVTDDVTDSKPAIKLKIKFGAGEGEQKMESGAEDIVIKMEPEDEEGPPKIKSAQEDTSDEEQQWLAALEAGTLDDNGDFKKSRDPSLLTARQRALLHGDRVENLLQLPSGYKAPELTEEQLQRRQQRAKKRREQAQEKREKDKKQTLERLLKKQDTKGKLSKNKSSRKQQAPSFRYTNGCDAVSISVPEGYSFPLAAEKAPAPKPVKQCGVDGCTNAKKYACSRTGIPLCSLACYKKNMLMRGLPMRMVTNA